MDPSSLRAVVVDAWADVTTAVDELLAAGRLPHRDVLFDMAGFLANAMPAVRAYERVMARLEER